jgi:hypothetical protein
MVRSDVEASRDESDPSVTQQRELVLQESAARTARVWTSGWFRSLSGEGRRVEGGWPGTVQEARARIAADAARALEDVSMPALTRDELIRLARITYEQARRLWRTSAGQPG